jgi:hypothetical protein
MPADAWERARNKLRMDLQQQRDIDIRKTEEGFALRDFIPIRPNLLGNHFHCLMSAMRAQRLCRTQVLR